MAAHIDAVEKLPGFLGGEHRGLAALDHRFLTLQRLTHRRNYVSQMPQADPFWTSKPGFSGPN
jgi:hypothetical protein